MLTKSTIFAAVACLVGTATAQTATVTVSSSSGTTAAPGETVTITATASYDLAGAGSGVFGSPGLFGFGGNADISGSPGAVVSPSAPVINPSLSFRPVAGLPGPALVRGAGGRGLLGGLADNPAQLMSFDLMIDPSASGTVTIDFEGAVVLVRDDALDTFSTDPGVNQATLTVVPLTLTIEQSVDCPGDLTTTGTSMGDPAFGVPDDLTNLSDLLFFVNVWTADLGTPTPNPGSIADITTTGGGDPGVPDGSVDLADLLYFVNEWTVGLSECPG